MNKDRETKQDYLRKEVIFKGYVPAQFSSFVEEAQRKKRGVAEGGTDGASNVDNWTLDELILIVKEFKSKHRPSEDVTDVLMVGRRE